MMQIQGSQTAIRRWDFDGNRRRLMQQKRERLLEADGRLSSQESTTED